eukprot:1161593-Pelagomonas_calceolata.AAC.2
MPNTLCNTLQLKEALSNSMRIQSVVGHPSRLERIHYELEEIGFALLGFKFCMRWRKVGQIVFVSSGSHDSIISDTIPDHPVSLMQLFSRLCSSVEFVFIANASTGRASPASSQEFYWTSHLLLAMTGLHDAHDFQQEIQPEPPACTLSKQLPGCQGSSKVEDAHCVLSLNSRF